MTMAGVSQVQPGEVIISLSHVSKFYGNFAALRDVSLDLRAGEVHMLLGENGAGKSTLVSLLTGVNRPDEGTRFLRGRPAQDMTPAAARAAGINAVLQDFSLAPSMTIAENYGLGREPSRFGLIRNRDIRRELDRSLATMGLHFPPGARVDTLSRAEQQLLEIARAIGGKPGVLILDEPTATLSHKESETLFVAVRTLRDEGWAILYISHRMEEVRLLGDVVTTLRDGRMTGFHRLADVDNQMLIAEIVGRELQSLYPDIPHQPGPALLEVRDLSCGDALGNMSFNVHAGEIVGIGGLVGCGKSEVGRAIFGLDPHGGEVVLCGERIARPRPAAMLERGLIFLPQDRRGEALAMGRSIAENITLEVIGCRTLSTAFGFVRSRKLKQLVRDIARDLRINPATPDMQVSHLSGGNQQKVVLGRAVSKPRRVFIFEEPTSGIDVGARMDFYTRLKQLAAGGAGIVLISSDLQELINLSHRVYILHEGQLSGEVSGDDLTEQAVAAHAFGDAPATAAHVH